MSRYDSANNEIAVNVADETEDVQNVILLPQDPPPYAHFLAGGQVLLSRT